MCPNSVIFLNGHYYKKLNGICAYRIENKMSKICVSKQESREIIVTYVMAN